MVAIAPTAASLIVTQRQIIASYFSPIAFIIDGLIVSLELKPAVRSVVSYVPAMDDSCCTSGD